VPVNNDDDNNNGLADYNETGAVAGEDDLRFIAGFWAMVPCFHGLLPKS